MQNKTVLMLFLATTAAVGATYYTIIDAEIDANSAGTDANGTDAVASSRSGFVFNGLDARVNDVAEISATSADGSITLRKDGSTWGLVERGGFPVEFERVQKLVVGLARLEISEVKTKKPENHAMLGLLDLAESESTSKSIELKSADGTLLASLLVGNATPQGVFVRRAGDAQVYLCDAVDDVESNPTEWLQRDIIRIDRKRIQSVGISHASGEEVQLERSVGDDTKFHVSNMPAGRELSSDSAATPAATALAYLALDDVLPDSAVDFNASPIARVVYLCDDGLAVVVNMVEHDERKWVRLAATFTTPIASRTPDTGIASAEPDPESLAAATEAQVRLEADELNERLTGWAFAIPDYKADAIAQTMEGLLLELPAEEAAPAEDGASDGGDAGEGAAATEAPLSLEDLLNPAPSVEDADDTATDDGNEAPDDQ